MYLSNLYYQQARHESIPEESQTCLGFGRKVCLILPFLYDCHLNFKSRNKEKKYNIVFLFFSGISYDKPLPPIQVASQRAERIAKEKKVIVGDVIVDNGC